MTKSNNIIVEEIDFDSPQVKAYKSSLKFQQQKEIPCNHYKGFNAKDVMREFDGLEIDETCYVCITCKQKKDRFEVAKISEDLRKKYNKTLKINYV